jgi:flagella basal body P-ring formation protein FlgA
MFADITRSWHAAVLAVAALSAPARTHAQAQTQTVLAPATLAAAVAVVRQAASLGAPPGARIEIEPGQLDSRLHLAPCERIEPYMSAGAHRWGHTRVGLRCVGGSRPWNVSLPVTVKVFAPALVSRGALPAGSVLAADNLQLAEVDWGGGRSPVQTRSDAVVGRTLARPLVAGQALRASDVKARQWFAAGDTVQIIASGDGFSVTGEGQALSNGIEGQSARVRTSGGRMVSGQPVGERRIEVAL